MSKTLGLPLKLQALTKRYGAVTALEPTDLEIGAGEFLTLLGPSGSGKTTLLNLVAGYTGPSGGTITIGTRDVTHVAARHRNIGMVFQSYALFPHMTVAQNLAYGLEARKLPKAEIAMRVESALTLVQLEGYGGRRIQHMSGGQQQRVAVARALVIEPDVLLMDEPLGALDRQLRRQVQLELRRLHLKHGRTTIYVTHDQEEALVLSDRIAVMANGRVQQLGTSMELYARPTNSFIAGFVGESNLLEALVTEVSDGTARADIPALSCGVTAPAIAGVACRRPAQLAIRPEHLKLATGTAEGITGTISEMTHLGGFTQFGVTLPSGAVLISRQVERGDLAPGINVRLSWEPAHALLVPAENI
jgi:spermidine/putrescine ABC transporter ATP-binding subunit